MYPGLVKSTGLVFAEKPSIGIEPTNLPDRSRFGNHGVHTNVTMVRLPSGLRVRSLDGSTSWIDLGTDSSLKIIDFSLIFWIKKTETVAGFRTIISSRVGNASGWSVIHEGPSAETLVFYLYDGAARGHTLIASGVTLDVWHHIGIIKSGLLLVSFLDGSLSRSQACVTGVAATSGLVLGRQYYGANHYWKGQIGPMSIVVNPLSAGQVKKIFEAQRPWFGV